jgi:hypothetical protein
MSAALSAQNPPATQTTQPASADKTVTLTGCVTPGTEGGTFLLSSVTAPAAMPEGSSSGGMLKGLAMSYDKSYKLTAPGGGVNVSAHAGHKVEVTGVVRDAPSVPAGTETDKMRSLEVRSLRMVAPTCS